MESKVRHCGPRHAGTTIRLSVCVGSRGCVNSRTKMYYEPWCQKKSKNKKDKDKDISWTAPIHLVVFRRFKIARPTFLLIRAKPLKGANRLKMHWNASTTVFVCSAALSWHPGDYNRIGSTSSIWPSNASSLPTFFSFLLFFFAFFPSAEHTRGKLCFIVFTFGWPCTLTGDCWLNKFDERSPHDHKPVDSLLPGAASTNKKPSVANQNCTKRRFSVRFSRSAGIWPKKTVGSLLSWSVISSVHFARLWNAARANLRDDKFA